MAPYRPPGRSNRSGRTNADNDIFEGLPVKQWTNAPTRVSLAPPVSEIPGEQTHDKWAALTMPRDWQMLQPWTQQLLRLARSGNVGQKRKAGDEANAEDSADQHENHDSDDPSANGLGKNGILGDNRAFIAKKWRHVPEHSLVPEHLHLEFLAKRRKGLPNYYHDLIGDGLPLNVPLRRTKVHKVIDAETGEVAVYDILVPEGQSVEGEVLDGSEYADKEITVLTAGSVIEGLGVANDEGVLVAELRNAAAIAQRRNRPPPKKKGGPGRGKKRVTFTNPDGSTYTTIVPNATKIVPQPGQTVKHVAKGEEAAADVTAEEAASMAKATGGDDDDEGDDEEGDEDEDGDEEGEAGDDVEEGEVAEVTKPSESAETVQAPPQIELNGAAETIAAPIENSAPTIEESDLPTETIAAAEQDSTVAEFEAIKPVEDTHPISEVAIVSPEEPAAAAAIEEIVAPIEPNEPVVVANETVMPDVQPAVDIIETLPIAPAADQAPLAINEPQVAPSMIQAEVVEPPTEIAEVVEAPQQTEGEAQVPSEPAA